MAAPIFRYSDSRLYGHLLTRPAKSVYTSCFKNFTNPLHPRDYKIAEYAIRLFKAAIGVLALLLAFPLACVGRFFQVIHYHYLSQEERDTPISIMVNGISLPKLLTINDDYTTCYHGTSDDHTRSILRSGLGISEGGAMGQALYVTKSKDLAKKYAQSGGVFTVFLDLDSREIAELDRSIHEPECKHWVNKAREQCRNYHTGWGVKFSEEKFQASLRKLFLRNGYRAIRYQPDLIGLGGKLSSTAIAVYDPSIVHIQEFGLRKGLDYNLNKSLASL